MSSQTAKHPFKVIENNQIKTFKRYEISSARIRNAFNLFGTKMDVFVQTKNKSDKLTETVASEFLQIRIPCD